MNNYIYIAVMALGLGPDGIKCGVGRLVDAPILPLLAHHLVFQPLVVGQAHQLVQRVFAQLGVLHDLLEHFFIIGLHNKIPLVYVVVGQP